MEKQGRRLFKPVEPEQARKSNFLDIEGGEEVDVLIGATLRRAREELGYDLQQVSEALRIRRAHLEALEEGRYKDLPGATYAIGFFRSYARFLGLNADEIVEQFKSQSHDLVKEQKLDFPLLSSEGRMPKVWLVVLAIVLAVLAYAGWQYFSRKGEMTADFAPATSDRLESMATETPDTAEPDASQPLGTAEEADVAAAASGAEPASPAAGEIPLQTAAESVPAGPATALPGAAAEPGAAGSAAPAETAPVETTPAEASLTNAEEIAAEPPETLAPPESAAAQALGPGEPAAPAAAESKPAQGAASSPPPEEEDFVGAAAEASAEGPAAQAASQGPIQVSELPPPTGTGLQAEAPSGPKTYGTPGGRVTITATADAWLQVMAPEGEILLSRTLHAGDVYYAPDRPGLTLTTGNAGALELRVDGKLTPALGAPGIVRRDVRLDPEVLRSETPPPE